MTFHRACILLAVAACGHVEAPADRPQTLTVSVTGGGSVTSMPAGITCGSTCTAQFEAGTAVTLTANADNTSAFTGWGSDCAGTGPCTLTMDGAKTAAAGFAVHGSKRWLAQVSFSGQDSMSELVVDPDGHVIAGGTVTDANGTHPFIIKYAKEDGHVLWMNKLDLPGTFPIFGGLATDAAGDVYFGMRLGGNNATVMIGSQRVTADLFGNIIVVRLASATGGVVWVKQWGGDGQDEPMALAVSGNDLYVVGGSSSNPSTFDAKSFMGSVDNGFVVRANTSDGMAVELKPVIGSVELFGVAVNGGHIAVVGQVRGATPIDRCNLSPSGTGSDAMIIDFLGSSLVCQWAKNFGDFTSGNDATTQAVAAYPGGGWVMVGDFKGNILLAPSGSSLTSHGGFDVFAGRFSGDGTHMWSFRYGDAGFDVGYGVAVTPEGNTILTGAFDATITFGGLTVTGTNNTFVTRMSAGNTPTHEWAVSLGGNDSDLAESVAAAPDGSVYVLSSFTGMTTVLGTSMTSQDYDAWIAALVR